MTVAGTTFTHVETVHDCWEYAKFEEERWGLSYPSQAQITIVLTAFHVSSNRKSVH